jgi:hypothetical protein
VPDCDEGVQWPKERNPIFFMGGVLRFNYDRITVTNMPPVRPEKLSSTALNEPFLAEKILQASPRPNIVIKK